MPRNPEEKIIIPLDLDGEREAREVIELMDGTGVSTFKVGHQLATSMGAPQAVKMLNEYEKKIFLDLKYHDIPNTHAKAAKAAARLGVWAFNIHASAGIPAMREAVMNRGDSLVLAVTVLTSIDDKQCDRIYGCTTTERQVYNFASDAARAGCDGIICSPREIVELRSSRSFDGMILVTPGIRPGWALHNDQKRTMTPYEAIVSGADHLVIGRPCTNPPAVVNGPMDAVSRIGKEIAEGLAKRGKKL